MAGNVWEWVSSLYKPYPYQADDGREDPSQPGDRVGRGGSWFTDIPMDLRAGVRGWATPSEVFDTIGFRCVRLP
jgi:formylglycine-generating enzyme required for sulfatase activity